MATATKLTADEYFAASVEGDRKQLVEGAIVVNEPKLVHMRLQATLLYELTNWTRGRDGRGLAVGPVDVVVDEHNVFGPDVLWIAERHLPADQSQRLPRVPDICAEIRSPGTWRFDIGAKKAAYERGGMPELWLVDDVAETVLIYRRSNESASSFDVALELAAGDAITSPQLQGFELGIAELFEIPF